jgi:hypothetical protein
MKTSISLTFAYWRRLLITMASLFRLRVETTGRRRGVRHIGPYIFSPGGEDGWAEQPLVRRRGSDGVAITQPRTHGNSTEAPLLQILERRSDEGRDRGVCWPTIRARSLGESNPGSTDPAS